ncbi:outer membrane protein [Bradyrhizobium sp. SYSU BS000235]|uniref:outer membrane protein n=1 Tax=Bradyrhizobium sp. SYSU BS000235 TaxID=3411332 RepID=UPI003C75B4FF
MKKIIAVTALIGTAATAQAADLPTKAPVYKAPILQPYNWTGFYAGVNAGVGFNRSYTTLGGSGDANRLGGLGGVGGAQIGYNWQFGNFLGFGNLVLGVETDIQGAGLNDDRTCFDAGTCGAGAGYDLHQKIDWFGTARGRVGLATGSVLTYFTGGFAYGNVKTTFNNTFNPADSLALSDTRTGWTVGSGVEAALGGNWTGKIEYLYLDLGNQNGVTPINALVVGSDVRASVFRAGLNYRIGGTGFYAPEPIANWSGFYIGGNGGGGTALNRSSLDLAGGATINKLNLSPDGYLGGAQIGYNWQAANWVYGLEADIQGSSLHDDRVCLFGCSTAQFVSFDQKLQWFGTVRGRVGYSLGSTLFYATGGLAYGGVKTRVQEFLGFIPAGFDQTFDRTKTGYTVGGGIESPFEFLGLFGKNWTAKTEYLYIDLGRSTDSYTVGGVDHTFTTRVQEHIFRTGLNYHFNSPVVAKY